MKVNQQDSEKLYEPSTMKKLVEEFHQMHPDK